MFECYNKKYLRINLTTNEVKTENITDEFIKNYIGGMGFGVKMLFDEVSPEVDAFSPDNKMIISTGPLTGTLIPLTAQTCLVTKSPASGGILNSYAGGRLASVIKSTGYDFVILEGKASELSYIYISDDNIEIIKCPELSGKTTTDVERKFNEKYGLDAISMSIGLAGENLVRFSAIVAETRVFGRMGPGAVMGSKNIKSIVFQGSKDVRVSNTEKFESLRKEIYDTISEVESGKRWSLLGSFAKTGTGAGMKLINDQNCLSTKNHKYCYFDKADDINGFRYTENYKYYHTACFSCPAHCGKIFEIDGELTTRGPEYETMYSFGSECMVGDKYYIALAHQICEDYGMDTLSAGNTVAFAMECYENGLITKEDTGGIELKFGNGKAMCDFLRKIVNRENCGNIFADGTKIASDKLGENSSSYAMNVKGLEFAAWMPQRLRGIALTFATSNRGACHKRAPIGAELTGAIDMLAIEGKAQIVANIQDTINAFFTLITCRFIDFEVDTIKITEVLNAATGLTLTAEEFVKIGEKIWNLERIFNLNSGMSKKDDWLPDRCFEPIKTSENGEELPILKREDLEYMLKDYYQVRGWDENGVPTDEKLEELGIELNLSNVSN